MDQSNLKPLSILAFLIGLSGFSIGQTQQVSLDEAINLALLHNKQLESSKNSIAQHKQLEGTAFEIDKTEIYYNFDQNNIAPNNQPLNVIGIGQRVRFPSYYIAQNKVLKQQTVLAKNKYAIDEHVIKKEITKAYFTISHWKEIVQNYEQLDSIYAVFTNAAKRKFELGESNQLELLLAQSKQQENKVSLNQSRQNFAGAIQQFNKWIQSDVQYSIAENSTTLIALIPLDTATNASLNYLNESLLLTQNELFRNRQGLLPDLNIGAFQGANNGASPNRYYGFQAGIGIPLFFGADKARIKASKTELTIKQNELDNYAIQLNANYASLITEIEGYKNAIESYQNFGQQLYRQTMTNATRSFESGEIDYLQYVTLIEHANTIQLNYIQNKFFCNLSTIEANYILN